jgi:uncharacterized damage-inducible protein DinB
VTIDDIQTLFAYHRWASKRIMTAAAELTPGQLTAPSGMDHGSLMGTLAHLLAAEAFWRTRCEKGVTPDRMLDATDFASFDALRQGTDAEAAAMDRYIAGLDDRDLQGQIAYRTASGKAYRSTLWHILFQLVNHGTHHRSEAMALLRNFGRQVGDLDFVFFLRERG